MAAVQNTDPAVHAKIFSHCRNVLGERQRRDHSISDQQLLLLKQQWNTRCVQSEVETSTMCVALDAQIKAKEAAMSSGGTSPACSLTCEKMCADEKLIHQFSTEKGACPKTCASYLAANGCGQGQQHQQSAEQKAAYQYSQALDIMRQQRNSVCAQFGETSTQCAAKDNQIMLYTNTISNGDFNAPPYTSAGTPRPAFSATTSDPCDSTCQQKRMLLIPLQKQLVRRFLRCVALLQT